jgi:hypothetical protein
MHPGLRLLVYFCNKLIFYGEELLSPTPNPPAGGPTLVGCLRLLIQYICNYPPYSEGVSSIRNLRTCHAMVTRDSPNMDPILIKQQIIGYFRYISDVIYEQNKANIEHTFIEFNKLQPSVKFAIEKELQESVRFLDLTKRHEDKNLKSSIYRKPT